MKNSLTPLCTALLLLAVRPAPAAPKSSAAPKPLPAATIMNAADLDKFYMGQMKRQNLVGLSLVVIQNGKVTATRCYGVASRATRQPVTPVTEFAIGSITKQFTAACILLLAEDGKLSVQDPVSKYYPDLTRASDITLLDLMNHVSGYRDYYPLDFLENRMAKPTTEDAVIADYARKPLDFEPDTRWSYSNTGYLILGRIVEKVSGQPLGEFMQARLLTPLGMTHTAFHPPAGTPGLAQGYWQFVLSRPLQAPREAEGWIGGAGSLYSTPSDLAKWDLALMSGKVLLPASLALMTTPRILKDGSPTEYGAGQFIKTRQGQLEWYHSGEVNGFIADNVMFPARHNAVIVTVNTEYGDFDSLAHHIYPALLGASGSASASPAIPPAATPPPVALRVDPAPVVHGPAAEVAARQMLAGLEKGQVDRALLGAAYDAFLTPTLLEIGAHSLRGWGVPTTIKTEDTEERGGMEVSIFSLTFGKGSLSAVLFRSPDGKIQEFLLSPVNE